MRALLLAALIAAPAYADAPQDTPLGTPNVLPTRDVDVTYKVPVPGATGTALLQRLRWSAALRRQRVDMPTSGNWMLLDVPAGTIAVVRDEARAVMRMPAPPGTGGLPGANYQRVGEDSVAGLACTLWRTTDNQDRVATACLTPDGVMLRAQAASAAGPRTMMEAVSVHYGPLDPAMFQIPAGYTAKDAAAP